MNFKLKGSNLIFVIILVFVIIFLGLFSLVHVQWAQDSFWHMNLIKNIAEGKGYTSDGIFPHGKYPPGLMILILPFYLIFKNLNFSGILAVGIISVLSIIITYKIGGGISEKVGLAAALLLVLNSLFIFNSVSIMTEIPFLFFSMASIYFFSEGFKKEIYFFPSLVFFALACLIRYDGFLLFIVFAIFALVKRKEIGQLNLNWLFAGIATSIIIIGTWFFRNWKVFGSLLASSYSAEVQKVTIWEMLKFLWIYHEVGTLFCVFSLIGIYYIIKNKEEKLFPYLGWFIIYIILHLYWWTRVLRFYTEIIAIICIFAAYGVIEIMKQIKFDKRKKNLILVILLILYVLSQSYGLFLSNHHDEMTFKVINRYGSIKESCEWANENLDNDSYFAVPDVAVYSLFLDKKNIIYYNDGLNNYLNGAKIYLFADTLHTWMTAPFLEGENGSVILKNNMATLEIKTNLIKKVNYENKSTTIILQPINFSIINLT